jgi:hypothetical protein
MTPAEQPVAHRVLLVHKMPISQNSLDSELELRWRTWLDKGKRTNRLADKRMKVLFSVVGVILLVWILFNVF